MNRKINLIALLLLGAAATPGQAQTQANALSPRIGLFGQASYNINSAAFSGLPGVPSCCPEYGSSSSIGFIGGLSYVSPFSSSLALDVRLEFASYGANFKATETQQVNLSGGPSTAIINYELNGSFTRLAVEPLLAFTVAPSFNLMAGISAGFVVGATYDQREILAAPTNATFDNQRRERNVFSGDIPDATTLLFGVTVGASYALGLNADKSLTLSPEVMFTYNGQPVAKDVSWHTHHVRGGLALHYTPPPVEDSLSDEELLSLARTIPAPERGASGVPFVATLSATGLTSDGRTQPLTTIRAEEFASTRIRPLLPYVFFDENSSEMSPRYRTVTEAQTENFREANFYNLDAMVTYQHMLNLIGRRMTDDPSASITLVGCTEPTEQGGNALAAKRAERVKSYLTDVWGIGSERVQTETRGLPENPSNQNEQDGREENRRVEIRASKPEILGPVTSNDTMRVFEPAGIRFSPASDPKSPVKTWTILVSDGDRLVKGFHAGDPIPPSVDWRMDEQSRAIPGTVRELRAMLVLRDSNGLVIPSETTPLPVSHVTLADKRNSGADKSVDRYSLILFGFDKADLSPENQSLVNSIKSRIKPNSSVKIVGYTDRTGADDYNQRLSDQRAKAVARALSVPEGQAAGLGERLPLYDNVTPEGRFYSRTVEVFVETPQR